MHISRHLWWIASLILVFALAFFSVNMFRPTADIASYLAKTRGMMASYITAPGYRAPDSGEEYANPGENPFVDSAKERTSTLSIDVDTASYTNVRRFIGEGHFPPEGAVRIEEMLNYFSYSYRDPPESQPFSITTELAACPWTPSNRLLHVGLKSKSVRPGALPPAHLTFLIDVSGSMQDPLKLPLVKSSFALLVEQLRQQDSVAIAVYAGAAGLVLPPTPGSQKQVIQDAIERLEAGGSTAGGEGIQLAYKTARSMYRQDANNRVILATDGDFNVGVSSDEELVRLIESERDHGVFLTVLGYGMGNLKDSKLEKIADHGNGHYAYVDSILEARRVLVEQLGATLQTVAKDVKVQVEFNPARVTSYRLIGYENRRLTAEDFTNDRKDAGDLGAGHSVTALYELVPAGAEPLPSDAFTVRTRFKPPALTQSQELTVPGQAETRAPSEDFRFAAAIAEFGMVLANSKHKGAATLESAIALAESGLSDSGPRRESVELMRKALELKK